MCPLPCESLNELWSLLAVFQSPCFCLAVKFVLPVVQLCQCVSCELGGKKKSFEWKTKTIVLFLNVPQNKNNNKLEWHGCERNASA